ncbi:DUF1643 domain-containing protein [Jeotgalibacillus soli]|uniref:DUF1643 domain-containing protein n=1 Tax=Jeotgalibacillus soli TaxID=889306 RepID=A0A0C2RNI3_9BACL|nr:DUF1643 domain-containing protein [Jeotgalibacillus soli]KIL51835.1 hypothetical protein KP78_02050 [Jeotgalibacillus soli]
MIISENKIISKSVMSEDQKYRYSLTKEWNPDKKKAAVIMLNPSKANSLKLDITIMRLTNYFVDNDYGGFEVVNLFAFMSSTPKELKNRDTAFEAQNDAFIIESAKCYEKIIIAWGSDNNKYVSRKREVIQLLQPYKEKLFAFVDEKGKKQGIRGT